MTYIEAASKFKKCQNKENGYKLAADTWLQKRGNAFFVRLYQTDIVIIRPDGSYRLNSGGYRTITTKKRMSDIIPKQISQSSGVWYVGSNLYEDGMLIDARGKPTSQSTLERLPEIKRMVDCTFRKFTGIMIQTLLGHRLPPWDSRMVVPKTSSEIYAKKLWHTVSGVVEYNKKVKAEIGSAHRDYWPIEFSETQKDRLMMLSILDGDYSHPAITWDMLSDNFIIRESSYLCKHSLRRFIFPRKITIAEMIASGRMSNG